MQSLDGRVSGPISLGGDCLALTSRMMSGRHEATSSWTSYLEEVAEDGAAGIDEVIRIISTSCVGGCDLAMSPHTRCWVDDFQTLPSK